MTIEKLYKDFCENFNKDHILLQDSSTTKWTEEILKYFFELGKDDYKVYTNPKIIKESEGSYLVDLCWSKEKGEDYRDYKGLKLILESEWLTNEREIMDDFCKLIDIKSFLKVMVICITEKEIGKIINKIADTIKSARIKFNKENYLVVIFVPVLKSRYRIEGYKIDSRGEEQRLKSSVFVLDN